jgi:hypothetical protein
MPKSLVTQSLVAAQSLVCDLSSKVPLALSFLTLSSLTLSSLARIHSQYLRCPLTIHLLPPVSYLSPL